MEGKEVVVDASALSPPGNTTLDQGNSTLTGRSVVAPPERGITGFTGTAIASAIGSLSLVSMSAGTIGFRARRPRT
jgi:hypothetical protein